MVDYTFPVQWSIPPGASQSSWGEPQGRGIFTLPLPATWHCIRIDQWAQMQYQAKLSAIPDCVPWSTPPGTSQSSWGRQLPHNNAFYAIILIIMIKFLFSAGQGK